MNRFLLKTVLACGLLSGLLISARAQEKPTTPAEAQFHRGFYLQVHEHDLAGAAAAFEKALADPSADEKLRQQARERLTAVREDMASVDLARLMPGDVMGYAEITEPGEHIARILKMMDLLGPPAAGADKGAKPIPLGNGLVLPPDFTVSPELVAELKKFRGAAVGVTAIEEKGPPRGLVVLHPGDCQLVRGIIETAVQILEQGEAIEGFKTYRVPELGWLTLTSRLVLAADSRDALAAAIGRLKNPQAESLADSNTLKRARAQAGNSLVFAYVDGQQVVKRFGSQFKGQEAAMIRRLLDLDHFDSAVVSLSTFDAGIRLQAQVNLTSGHHNVLYALIRTAPISKRTLPQVPKGAAGVVLIGLNPPGPAVPQTTDASPPQISAMDIGREFFNNIEELAVYAIAPEGSPTDHPMPEVGVVIAVKDVAKSEALWNQILSLATLFGAKTDKPMEKLEIEGKPAHVYHFAGVPPIAVVRSPERGLVVGTQAAVAASLRASLRGESIVNDPDFGGLLKRLTPNASKAVLIDAGRAAEIAAALSGGRGAKDIEAVGKLVRELKFSIVTDEAPDQLTITAELTGLPKFRAIAEMISAQQGGRVTSR